MEMSRFHNVPSAEARREARSTCRGRAVASAGLDSRAVTGLARAEPWAARSRGQTALQVIGLWLRRTLADSARAWALAAGVPPHLYNTTAADEPTAMRRIDD